MRAYFPSSNPLINLLCVHLKVAQVHKLSLLQPSYDILVFCCVMEFFNVKMCCDSKNTGLL